MKLIVRGTGGKKIAPARYSLMDHAKEAFQAAMLHRA